MAEVAEETGCQVEGCPAVCGQWELVGAVEAECARLQDCADREGADVEAALAPALGYAPMPGGSLYDVGEHTPVTLAMQAAGEIARLRAALEEAENRAAFVTTVMPCRGCQEYERPRNLADGLCATCWRGVAGRLRHSLECIHERASAETARQGPLRDRVERLRWIAMESAGVMLANPDGRRAAAEWAALREVAQTGLQWQRKREPQTLAAHLRALNNLRAYHTSSNLTEEDLANLEEAARLIHEAWEGKEAE